MATIIFCDRSVPESDIGWIQVNSATLINPRTGKVFNRPSDLRTANERMLTPAELAVYLEQNPPTGFFDNGFYAHMLSIKQEGGQPGYLVWFHVDYTKFLEQERVPVQPALDRLTTVIRHRLAVRNKRETILFTELAMALHDRVGNRSLFRLLPHDLFKRILNLAA